MIENGESCDAVMLQLKALHGSLNKVSDLLIQSHLTECLPGLLAQQASPEIDLFLSEFSDLVLNARRR
jgi:DNA-binding FrmR family transcriptional regulator